MVRKNHFNWLLTDTVSDHFSPFTPLLLKNKMSQKTSSAANGDIDVLHDPKKAAGAAVEQGRRVVTGLTGMYLLVAGAVSLSWLVGYLDFSYVWSFLLTAALFVIWKAKIKKIIKQYLNIEEADLYRRRAFRQNETAEWLNFLLNRW